MVLEMPARGSDIGIRVAAPKPPHTSPASSRTNPPVDAPGTILHPSGPPPAKQQTRPQTAPPSDVASILLGMSPKSAQRAVLDDAVEPLDLGAPGETGGGMTAKLAVKPSRARALTSPRERLQQQAQQPVYEHDTEDSDAEASPTASDGGEGPTLLAAGGNGGGSHLALGHFGGRHHEDEELQTSIGMSEEDDSESDGEIEARINERPASPINLVQRSTSATFASSSAKKRPRGQPVSAMTNPWYGFLIFSMATPRVCAGGQCVILICTEFIGRRRRTWPSGSL